MGYKRNGNDVAGVYYPNHNNNQVKATIDFEDLCRAVRRCIINDLVADAQDENSECGCGHKKCKCRN